MAMAGSPGINRMIKKIRMDTPTMTGTVSKSRRTM
jgi:hypothetical protein